MDDFWDFRFLFVFLGLLNNIYNYLLSNFAAAKSLVYNITKSYRLFQLFGLSSSITLA